MNLRGKLYRKQSFALTLLESLHTSRIRYLDDDLLLAFIFHCCGGYLQDYLCKNNKPIFMDIYKVRPGHVSVGFAAVYSYRHKNQKYGRGGPSPSPAEMGKMLFGHHASFSD
jgi:hypothetical protein